jgi:hypothetical protein
VNVVSYAGAVFSRVVVSEHTQLWSLAYNNLLYVGEEIVGMYKRLIANEVGRMSSTWIEVTQ